MEDAMDRTNVAGKWALVTGASSGLGVDFARTLAEKGSNLVLVARREERLQEVAAELEREFGVEARAVPFDLAQDQAPRKLYQTVIEKGLEVDILINNAGFGLYGQFLEQDWETEKDMIDLNVQTLVGLTRLFVKDMVKRNFGYVLLVASTGAYQPTPYYAAYSASKSFVLSFGEALNYELKESPVSSTVISPGVTRTEFHEVSGQGRDNPYVRLTTMESSRVARIGIQALLQGKPSVVPGWLNKITAWFALRMPRRLATWAAARMMAG
jgi:hypothetical protein